MPRSAPSRALPSRFPGEAALLDERAALVTTVRELSPEQFENAPTLCAGWAPRDVLAHLIGIDESPLVYLRFAGRVNAANARIVAAARSQSREQLLERAEHWAVTPALHARLAAYALL